jgi:N4-gp56 family major capsid protein
MAITKSTDTGVVQRTNAYAAVQMLKHAGPTMVLGKFGMNKPIPQNKSTTIKFRRPVVFTAATTPLVEGVTPSTTGFSYEDVSVSIKQYGQVIGTTDVIKYTHEDPVLNDISEQAGENIGRTIEALNYGVLKGGTNVFYANGTGRGDVNTAITLTKQRAVTRALKAQKAMKISKMLGASVNISTEPVEAAYVAVAHTDLEADLRGLSGFIPVAEYAQAKPLCPEEIGRVEDVRYILSADLGSIADAGDTKGSMVSTTGTDADVYPVLYFGREAFGTVALKGKDAVSPSIIPVDEKTKDDPLGQRGYVGWKTWHACVILNEAWMARLEVACTDL